jgi:hypothetical protein
MIIVQSANSFCSGSKTVCRVVFSAIPVTIPGRAIGKTTNRESADFPKKLYRETAKAIAVPSNNAITVAPIPTFIDDAIDPAKPALWPIFCHQIVERLLGGQLNVFEGLNEFTTTVNSGI